MADQPQTISPQPNRLFIPENLKAKLQNIPTIKHGRNANGFIIAWVHLGPQRITDSLTPDETDSMYTIQIEIVPNYGRYLHVTHIDKVQNRLGEYFRLIDIDADPYETDLEDLYLA